MKKTKKQKKAKQRREQWMDALAILAFGLQIVEFGMTVWDKWEASQKPARRGKESA